MMYRSKEELLWARKSLPESCVDPMFTRQAKYGDSISYAKALRFITELKKPAQRQDWIERFSAASPDWWEWKGMLKHWIQYKSTIGPAVVVLFRFYFQEWKRFEKSRSAKKASRKGITAKKHEQELRKESQDTIHTFIGRL